MSEYCGIECNSDERKSENESDDCTFVPVPMFEIVNNIFVLKMHYNIVIIKILFYSHIQNLHSTFLFDFLNESLIQSSANKVF